MQILDAVDAASLRTDIPEFGPGDTIKVHVNITEGTRSRIQVFQGFVLGRSGDGVRETFTVRKISFQVGVERTFPVHSPARRPRSRRSATTESPFPTRPRGSRHGVLSFSDHLIDVRMCACPASARARMCDA